MADPVSVTGTAVGIISLGLQVCGQIVKYSQAVRGQNEEIGNLATKADHLRGPLKELRDLIEETESSSPKAAQDLEEKAFSLQVYVERLQEKVEQYKPISSDTVHGKARSALKKAVYPFKKETLFEIDSCLDGMQTTLQTALAM